MIWRRSLAKYLVPIPNAHVVWPIVGQEILNGDMRGGFRGIQITSMNYNSIAHNWCIGLCGLNTFCRLVPLSQSGPKLACFQDVESMLNHHLAGLLGLGSLSWAGYQVHVSLSINQFIVNLIYFNYAAQI
ncbi:hypothetical protein CXB51_004544 [Gossypium anomalum]|uniref:Uncharacterized protein n=1 Tax=Gossypium anomalum TaxID=47600 RepID=A0A8J5Z5A5_9ROSI|nr:hypothetical protein CXB51_004544 [Gossypium anomalum]